MKNLMKKENLIMVGVGVVAFMGVRYLLNKQNEEKSNFSRSRFRKRPRALVPSRGGFVARPRSINQSMPFGSGGTKAGAEYCMCSNGHRCKNNASGTCTCCSGMEYETYESSAFSGADGGCGCGA
jgi:hypothetical protein